MLRPKRILLAIFLLLTLFVASPISVVAQGGPFSAQIQLALRAFLAQANTWTGTQTFANVVISGTCTGSGCGSGGGAPGGSNNAVQYRINGTTFGGVALNASATPMYLQQVSSGVAALVQVAFSDLSGAVNLATQVSGNLAVTNLNSGTSASSSTFWRGDGTWATPTSSGVTSVSYSVPAASIFGVTGSPVTTTGTLGLTTTGTSGAVPYFSSGSVISSSLLLAAHGAMIGGGSLAAPLTVAGCTNGSLTWTSSGADPTCATRALTHATPANPSSLNSAAFLHFGFGTSCTITPTSTGRVVFTISGDTSNSVAADIISWRMRYGTGTAPANAAAETGTLLTAPRSTLGSIYPASITSAVTGLTVNTAYWFDIVAQFSVGGTVVMNSVDCTASEY